MSAGRRRNQSLWGLVLLACSLAGCPGDLDPRLFEAGVQGGTCSSDDLQRKVFNVSCITAGCHNSSVLRAGGLDLMSPGVEQRLVGMPVPAGQICTHGFIIVPGDPAHSLLFQKIEPSPPCGNRMPLGTVSGLTDTQIECVRSWIASLPMGPPLDSGVPPMDAAMDTHVTETGVDGNVDGRRETGTDGPVSDIQTDIVADTGADAASDIVPDMGIETGSDVVSESAPVDTGSPMDAGVDAAADATVLDGDDVGAGS